MAAVPGHGTAGLKQTCEVIVGVFKEHVSV